jgi:four helix bundle protein
MGSGYRETSWRLGSKMMNNDDDDECGAVQEETEGQTFEKLKVWQEAVELAVLVYRSFRNCRDFEFRRQIQAAAVSVSSNIAEGYERSTNQEFIRFLDIARGSCGEVRSQSHVALSLGLITPEEAQPLLATSTLLSKRIGSLMKVRREKFG